MRLSPTERIGLQDGTDDSSFTFQHLIEHFIIVNMVAAMPLHRTRDHLLFTDCLHRMKRVARRVRCVGILVDIRISGFGALVVEIGAAAGRG